MQPYSQIKNHEINCFKVSPSAPVLTGDDIPAKRIVRSATEGTVLLALNGTATLTGVSYNSGDIGDQVDVQTGGIAVVTASAAVVVGAQITATALGKAVTAAATDFIIGYALTAASGADVDFSVQMEIGTAD